MVRVNDGEELGTAVTPYRHGVMDGRYFTGAAAAAGLGAAGPETTSSAADACRPRCGRRRRPGRRASASPPTSPPAPCCPSRRRHAAVRAARVRDRPHAYVKLWKHHAAQPRPTGSTSSRTARRAWLHATAARSPPSGFSARPCSCSRKPRRSTPAPTPGRGRRLDRLADDGLETSATPARQATRHLSGRRLPSPRLRALDPGFADFVETSSPPIGALGDTAGRLTAAGRRAGRAAPGIAVAVANVDAHVTAPAAQARRPGKMVTIMGTSTCHVLNATRCTRSRHVRRRRRRDHPRLLGLRGRPERRRRHLRLVRRQPGAGRRTREAGRAGSRPRAADRGPRRSRSGPTAWSPSTGTAATARCWSTTSCPALVVGQTLATRPRTSTARSSRPPPSARAPSSRRSRTRACPSPSSSSPAGCSRTPS